MTEKTTPVVPKVLPVTTGAIEIHENILDVDNIHDLSRVFREVNHLLSLIPEEDLHEAVYEETGWLVYTDNEAALKYAWKNDFLDPFSTAMACLIDKYGEDHCCDCVDEILDDKLSKDFSVDLLTDGLYVVFGEK
jgi:hypothetical protein